MYILKRINFSKIEKNIKYPNLLKLQIKFFNKFFNIKTIEKKKKKIYKIFNNIFPIYDKKKNFKLKFLNYYIEPPKYSINECINKGFTYSVIIKIKLELINFKTNKKIIQKVYLGNCPYMTNNGSFIFNGAERVVVYQLNRSPGIFFGNFYNFNGLKLYYARVIPFKGSWIELITDNDNCIYICIDRKKKVPLIVFLRAIGYKKNSDIKYILNLYKKIKIIKKNFNKIENKINAKDIKIKNYFIRKNEIIDKNKFNFLLKKKIKFIYIKNYINKKSLKYNIINNIIKRDYIKSYSKSLFYLYKKIKNIYPPDKKIALKVINELFYNKKKYDLNKIGRYKINKRLNINISYKYNYLTKLDYKYIIKYLINLINSKKEIDDIDHLSNRKVKTVGDQLYQLFNIGLSRMSKLIKDKINIIYKKNKNFKPIDLINSKILNSIINSFFGTSQLSQFMDKTNPLSEITHKRRLTLLGPGGLIRERASFEARDVNYSHYGKLCPIETPEGPNIGLITSLCLYAKINNMGFLQTPYNKVKNGKIIKKKIYLTSEEEINKIISPFNIKKNKKVMARKDNDYILINFNKVNYIDYCHNQIVSLSAGLIPFLEHDDANRALMGSNMMRQAVPLLKLESPIVGTGLEKNVINDHRIFIKAKENGIVKYVDSKKIIIKYNYSKNKKLINFYKKNKIYNLKKFKRTNQNTCINLKPIIKKGDKVYKNQLLCEGYTNKNGELSLGKNLLVAFMSWKGYNFEDAILISNKIIKNDGFTSIHIDEYSLELRDTKYGKEEFTRYLPNINNKLRRKLDKNGIIKVGSYVNPGDILIGKIIPKEKINLTPEEKLLKSIFGDKYTNIKNVSLKAHNSLRGIVIKTKIYEKKKIKNYKYKLKELYNKYKKKKKKIIINLIKKLKLILKKIKFKEKNIFNIKKKFFYKKKKLINLIKKNKKKLNYKNNKKKKILIKKILNNYKIKKKIILNKYKKKKFKIMNGDILPNNILKIAKVYIAKKRILKVGDKMSGRHGNKGVISKIINEEDMPFLKDGTTIDIILNPLSVPSRMNIGQVLESILGYIGYKLKRKFSTPVFNGKTKKYIYKYSKIAKIKDLSRYTLYDGQTGEKFNKKITIGVIYMFKLDHMIDDKIHARSIGPYSLITQQPLGGKAQFGGQRLGEMEVWALEAFGVSNILRELLTIKSDDIKGRIKTYEAIIKGKILPKPNIPEAFKVLINELKGLCLKIDFN